MPAATAKSKKKIFVAQSLWSDDDDVEWAARNQHWSAVKSRPRRYIAKRERRREPLILCGHGVSLKVDKGTLLVRDGFTHWPQERTEYRFFKGGLDLPPRIVMLDGSGSLTFDVMTWLSEQRIPLIRLDYQGEVVSVIGGAGFAMIPERVQWQIETRNDPQRRLEFSCNLIRAKLQATLVTLRDVIPDSSARAVAVSRTEGAIHQLESGLVHSIEELRMIEASAAASYFNSWKGLPIKWQSRWKHPVPDKWLTVGPRGSGGARSSPNKNAKHPVNAMLNYAYGLLSAQVHIEAVSEGFDPRRGVMHHDREDGDAFAWVFDQIEPRRAEVDAALLKFILGTPLVGADFAVRADGVCRLAPQLARVVAAL